MRRFFTRSKFVLASLVTGVLTVTSFIVLTGLSRPGFLSASRPLPDTAFLAVSGTAVALVSIGLLQLAVATWFMAKRDARRLLRDRGPAGRRFPVDSEEGLASAVRAANYRGIGAGSEIRRFVKHPAGFFGATVLHAGLLLAGIGVAAVALTQSTGLLTLVEGAPVPAGTPLEDPSRGWLGAPAVAPVDITLERVDASFWPTGEPRRYVCTYLLSGASGPRRVNLAVNAPQRIDGARYHQENRIGYAFFLTIDGPAGTTKQRLDMPQPPSASEASYLTRQLPDGAVLDAKCEVDEPAGAQPVLTVRLSRDGTRLGQATLSEGDAATVGPYRVSADAVFRWAVLTIDRSCGYGILFPSFFVIFLGGVLLYGFVPREVTVWKAEDGTVWADWYAPRFADWYRDELKALEQAARGETEEVA